MAQRYSSKRPLSATDLKEFRSHVARLKKQGVIPSNVDARSARPYFVRGGKTLAEYVNKDLNPPAPKPKLATARQPITVRNLPNTKHRSLAGLLKDMEEHADEINALKKPDEFFGFRIAGTDSIAPYRTIKLLIDELKESAGIQYLFNRRSRSAKEVFDTLQIIRWNQPPGQWYRQRKVRGLTPSALKRQAKYRRKKK